MLCVIESIEVYLVLKRLTNMREILRKDLCSNPPAKMLEETSILEEIKEDANFDEIWMSQYEA